MTRIVRNQIHFGNRHHDTNNSLENGGGERAIGGSIFIYRGISERTMTSDTILRRKYSKKNREISARCSYSKEKEQQQQQKNGNKMRRTHVTWDRRLWKKYCYYYIRETFIPFLFLERRPTFCSFSYFLFCKLIKFFFKTIFKWNVYTDFFFLLTFLANGMCVFPYWVYIVYILCAVFFFPPPPIYWRDGQRSYDNGDCCCWFDDGQSWWSAGTGKRRAWSRARLMESRICRARVSSLLANCVKLERISCTRCLWKALIYIIQTRGTIVPTH